MAAFIVDVLGVAYSTVRESSALTRDIGAHRNRQYAKPSSRKNPLRAAISSGRVLRAGTGEAIFYFSAALTIDGESVGGEETIEIHKT